jgi:hypothetical protein
VQRSKTILASSEDMGLGRERPLNSTHCGVCTASEPRIMTSGRTVLRGSAEGNGTLTKHTTRLHGLFDDGVCLELVGILYDGFYVQWSDRLDNVTCPDKSTCVRRCFAASFCFQAQIRRILNLAFLAVPRFSRPPSNLSSTTC